MSWMEMLYRTYENSQAEVGEVYPAPLDRSGKPMRPPRPLLPVCHTLQTAHLEVTLDMQGNYIPHTTTVVDKVSGMTVIPCTENSATRARGLAPHPLFDNLKYLAGDYLTYGGNKEFGYDLYLAQLEDWCNSSHAHPAVCAVLAYLKKGCLIADLIADGILVLGEDGKVLPKWEGEREQTPALYKLLADPLTAFVRFCVRDPAQLESALFRDKQVQDSYIAYRATKEGTQDLCYVQGKVLPRAQFSPKFIRNPGDGAKLISANDSTNFTYRGRFSCPEEAFSVGFETTNKAHNALKWLIDRQGWHNGDQVILAWGTKNETLPSLQKDGFDLFASVITQDFIYTYSDYAARLNAALQGYRAHDLDENAEIVVMVLDSATPGRLSIPYYRELSGSQFLDRILFWHSSCIWLLNKTIFDPPDEMGKITSHRIHYQGAPTPMEIVYAAYGRSVSDKLKKAAIERLIPCIVDAAPIPKDLMLSAVHRASNPPAMEGWEYEETLGIACALVRKFHNDRHNPNKTTQPYQEVYTMALDTNNLGRSYLFGRVLAYYDSIEAWALGQVGEKRMTNAKRMVTRFRQMPAKTAEVLERQLEPYVKRLKGKGDGWLKQLNKLYALLDELDAQGNPKYSNRPLDETYLLGYRSQLYALQNKEKEQPEDEGEE